MESGILNAPDFAAHYQGYAWFSLRENAASRYGALAHLTLATLVGEGRRKKRGVPRLSTLGV